MEREFLTEYIGQQFNKTIIPVKILSGKSWQVEMAWLVQQESCSRGGKLWIATKEKNKIKQKTD